MTKDSQLIAASVPRFLFDILNSEEDDESFQTLVEEPGDIDSSLTVGRSTGDRTE